MVITTALYLTQPLGAKETSSQLNLRNYNAQVGELLIKVKTINKVIGLRMTTRY